jgi:hypothetical protein
LTTAIEAQASVDFGHAQDDAIQCVAGYKDFVESIGLGKARFERQIRFETFQLKGEYVGFAFEKTIGQNFGSSSHVGLESFAYEKIILSRLLLLWLLLWLLVSILILVSEKGIEL